MPASQIYSGRLRNGLSRLEPSALGLNGSSLAKLCFLPNTLLGWPAGLLREVERLGKWPARLVQGYTTLILK